MNLEKLTKKELITEVRKLQSRASELDKKLQEKSQPTKSNLQIPVEQRFKNEHKESPSDMDRSVKEWQTTFNATADAIWILSKDSRILRCNETAERLFEMPSYEQIGKHCWEIVHHTSKPIPECPNLRAKKSLHRETMELQIDERWFQVTVDPILDDKGKYNGAIHVISDITEHKRMENDLRTERDFAQNLLATAQTIILTLDKEGRIVDFNPFTEEISGFKIEEVKGKDWFTTFIPEREQKRIRRIFKNAVGNILTKGNINTIVTKNGQERLIEWYDKTIKDADGKVIGVLSTGQDVTEREQARMLLIKSEEKYRALVENVDEIIMMTDANGNFQFINRSGVEKTGYSFEELTGLNYLNMIHPDHKRRVQTHHFKQYLKRQLTSVIEYPIISKSGEIRWMTQTSYIRTDENNIIGFYLVAHDITERKQAEEALQASEICYRRLFESAKDGILILDAKTGKIIDANPFILDLLGKKYNEFIGKDLYELDFSFRKITADKTAFLKLLQEKSIRYEALPLKTASGEIAQVEFISSAYKVYEEPIIQCNIRDITERKEAEAALQESEERYSALFEKAQDGIVLLDPETGSIVHCNSEFEAQTGRSIDVLRGMKIWELRPPDKQDLSRVKFFEIAEKGSGSSSELGFQKPDGSITEIEFKSYKIEFGNYSFIESMCRDITERKQHEEELRKSEAKHRTYIENSPTGVFVADGSGKYIDVNQSACNLTGYSRDELLNMTIKELSHPDFLEQSIKSFHGLKKTGVLHDEALLKRKNGTSFYSTLDAVALPNETYMAFCLDISERKQAEEALRESKERLSRIFDTAPGGITIVNLAGKVTFANTAAEKILGLSRSQVTGRTYNDPAWKITAVDGSPFPEEELPFARVMATGAPVYSVEHAIVHPDGKCIVLSINGAPYKDASGNIAGMIAGINDITERKQVELEIEANRELLHRSIEGMMDAYALHEAIFDESGRMKDYRFQEFNPAAERISEIIRDEIVGKTVLELYPHIVDSGLMDKYADVMETGETAFIEDFYYEGDSLDKVFDIACFKIDEKHFVCIFRDVTERKQSEETIRKSEAFLNEIIEQSPYAIWISDTHGKLIRINPKCCDVLDITPDDVLGKYNIFNDNIIKEQGFMPLVREVFEKGHIVNFTLRWNAPKLQSIKLQSAVDLWLDVTIFPILNEAGELVNAVIQHVDITDQMLAEEALRRSEALLETTQSISRIGGWEWDVINNKMYWTRETYLIYDFDPSEFGSGSEKYINRSIKCYAEDDRQMVMDAFNRCVETGEPYDLECQFTTAKG